MRSEFKKEIRSTLIYDDDVLFDGKGNYIFGDKKERERGNREAAFLEENEEEIILLEKEGIKYDTIEELKVKVYERRAQMRVKK